MKRLRKAREVDRKQGREGKEMINREEVGKGGKGNGVKEKSQRIPGIK